MDENKPDSTIDFESIRSKMMELGKPRKRKVTEAVKLPPPVTSKLGPVKEQQIKIVESRSHFFLVVIFIMASFFGGVYYGYHYVGLNKNIERQKKGDLTEEEKKFQEANAEINRLKSEVETAKKLKKLAEEDSSFKTKELEKIQKDYNLSNLKIDSLTKALARLEGKTENGTFEVRDLDGAKSLLWTDEYNRFHLLIPNINEKKSFFTYDQHFQINLVVLKQQSKDGALRVQTLHLYETTADGKIIGEATVDMKNSSFRYVIDSQKDMPAHHWLVNLSNKGELLVTYLPINKYDNMIGFGLSAGANTKNDQFVGLTVMGFPPTWYKSRFGVGASVGYSPQTKGVAWRVQVAWSFADLFRK